MPRPRKHRQCRVWEGHRVFKPLAVPLSELEVIKLEMSELEAMRLCDFDLLDQVEAGKAMKVSRGTIHRLLKSGRQKVLRALLQSTALEIEDDSTPRKTN